MIQLQRNLMREKPCAVCGYDLRAAAVGGKCPECGTEIKAGVAASRIPWVHRRQIGRVKAYVKTVWMVIVRPGKLAREVERPVVLKDARRFYWVSVGMGAVIAAGLMAWAFSIGRDWSSMPSTDEKSFWIVPVFVLLDRWWGLLVLAAALWIVMRVSLACFRWILVLGTDKGYGRGRLWRVSLYAAALAPVEGLVLGLLLVGAMALNVDTLDFLSTWILIAMFVMGIFAMAVFLLPAMVLIARSGRFKVWRGILVVVGFPVVTQCMTAGLILVAFWVAGYLAMAIRSMMF